MPKTEFDYYYGAESEQFSFVRVPRVLFTDKEHFDNLSNEAKLMYGLLLERMSLSRKNNQIDKHNRVYIIFPVEEIEESLDVGHEKALNLLKELDDQSGIGLVKKKRRGLGLPSILYVKNFIVKGEQNTDRVPTSRSTVEEKVKKQIDYDCLISHPDSSVVQMAEEIKALMVDVLCGERSVVSEGKRVSEETAKAAYRKITFDHVQYVMKSLVSYPDKISRIDRFLTVSLFNSVYTLTNSTFAGFKYDMRMKML